MKLYELFGSKGFHTCIATTFGVDFGAYESIVLPRLRGAGCFNNLLMADARMLSYALDGASTLPQHAGRHYTVTGVGAAGVFHPKVTLQLGQQNGRLIVASANVTAAGLAGNLELAGYIHCRADDLGERRLIAAAWHYCRALVGADERGQEHQVEWLRPRTPWLFDIEPAESLVTLSDGTDAALLRSGLTRSIGANFAALVEERPVKRLIVMSPYWDRDLQALKFLTRALQPRETLVLIDSQTALFPATTQKRLHGAHLFELGDFSDGRFVHGKMIIAETAKADHVLYGSANCTVAALGTERLAGSNEEVCLYRRLKRKSVISALGLTDILDPSNQLEASTLPAYAPEDPLPLDEASLRSPGRFECLFDTLFWWPPLSDHQLDRIELLDAAGEPLPTTVTLLPNGGEHARRYRIADMAHRPTFARLRFKNGTVSAPAIVTVVDKLRETIRDVRGKRAEAAAIQLADETEEGLWLWEILNELEAADAKQNGSDEPGARHERGRPAEADDPETYRTLDYDRFVAGRRLTSDASGAARNSLVGSDLSLVRDFINRILTLEGGAERNDRVEEANLAQGLDLGDETGDAQDALENGSEFSPQPDSADSSGETAERKRLARRKATRQQIVSAVETFNQRIKTRADGGRLTSFDILRFRAILMIVAAAGLPVGGAASNSTQLQVLPCDDGPEAWPRLIGRLVFTLFGGNHPAIRHLQIETIHDEIPDDILECWATALWATQACAAAAMHGAVRNMQTILNTLVHQTYARTSLRRDELESGRLAAVFDRLNDRFGERLGLPAPLIGNAHARAIAGLFASKMSG